jgi:hypothetical protein
MRALALGLLFFLGVVIAAIVVAPVIFARSFVRRRRSFHPSGTVCLAELTPLAGAGPRLEGAARVRLSSATAPENAPDPSILGMAIKLAHQDLPLATFEAFAEARAATARTNVADYLGNQYASVAPWRAPGLGVVWLRAIPEPVQLTTGTRVERLEAAVAVRGATFVLEAREAPGPHAAVRARLATLRLTQVLREDDPAFQISMFRTAGLVPTGFRNGVRAVVYPVSQLARRLRGG